jgi:hypothetical protein
MMPESPGASSESSPNLAGRLRRVGEMLIGRSGVEGTGSTFWVELPGAPPA